MPAAERLPILVGVDGSEPSLAACRWAADEARLRGHPVHLVYGYIGPALAVPLMTPPYDWLPEQLRREGDEIIAGASAAVQARAPEVAVTSEVAAGAPGHLLVDLSGTAHLVVVGHRGHGGFGNLLLGSVASTVAAHAHPPVIVVRPGAAGAPARTAPVVVGVDGSEQSQAALQFGFEEAGLRGVPLHAVHAYHPPPPPWRADLFYDPAEVEAAERDRLQEWLRPVRERHPEVPVELRLVAGHAAAQLVETGQSAALLVVGSRGRGGFTGLLLGSVSQQVVRHATGPVAVAR